MVYNRGAGRSCGLAQNIRFLFIIQYPEANYNSLSQFFCRFLIFVCHFSIRCGCPIPDRLLPVPPEIFTERKPRFMETAYQNIAGKSAGEVARDIADFLSLSCPVQARQEMDLANLLPDLTMKEQFSFALLMEARTQGWEQAAAEGFYLRACAPIVGNQTAEAMLAAFRQPDGEAFREYLGKYGCDFGLSSHSYWTACLAVAVDAKAISTLMGYLRSFTFCLMEFAFMDDRNPDVTYAWRYYESFQRILEELTTAPSEPAPLKVCSLGGSAGKRENDSYPLSLGVDLQNPNSDRMAWNVQVDTTLKDRDGNVITVIGDRVNCIDPGAVFHYGITRKIHGPAVAHISVSAKAGAFTRLTTPVMKHIRVTRATIKRQNEGRLFSGSMVNRYDCPIRVCALHYQFLSDRNKILGGGCEWLLDGFPAGGEKNFSVFCPVPVPGAAKVVYSVDFDAQELLQG